MNYYYFVPLLLVLAIAFSGYFVCMHTKRKDLFIRGQLQSYLAKVVRNTLMFEYAAHETRFFSENLLLAGLFFKREKPKYLFIICHGYLFNKEGMHKFASLFENDNIFLFDFRTHGESEGTYISFGCKEAEDVKAAVHHAKSLGMNKHGDKDLPIVLIGISMGGAAALKAAADEPELVNALVIDSAFSSFYSMARAEFKQNLWFLPRFPLIFIMKKFMEYNTSCNMDDFAPIKSITKIKNPIFLIHSEADKFIPFTDSQDLQSKATGYCDLWIAPPCKHGFAFLEFSKLAKEHVYKFLSKTIS